MFGMGGEKHHADVALASPGPGTILQEMAKLKRDGGVGITRFDLLWEAHRSVDWAYAEASARLN